HQSVGASHPDRVALLRHRCLLHEPAAWHPGRSAKNEENAGVPLGLSEGQLIRSTVTAGHSNGQITSGRVATNMGASDYCPRSFPHSAPPRMGFSFHITVMEVLAGLPISSS